MSLLLSGLWIIFILPLIKFPWNALIFSKQLLLDTWKHWEEKAPALPTSPSLQLFFWVTSCQNINAISKSSLLASEAKAFGELNVLGHGAGKILEVSSIILMAKLKAGLLFRPLVQLWCVLPVEAAFESWHFAGTDSSPNGRLGLQWKVDSSTVPGM
ncbi:unnamed protein product [Pipistrellus nathusii]|uniref:Uncharacterized protein n=1 Tax=Pipistrellus nathusii TaxID=59473 RepID=A0ABP0ACD0_PIPNA